MNEPFDLEPRRPCWVDRALEFCGEHFAALAFAAGLLVGWGLA